MQLVVVPQMAPLTHGLEVIIHAAERVALAGTSLRIQVRHREHDVAASPASGATVSLGAATWPRVRAMQSALPLALALASGSISDALRCELPVRRVLRACRHQRTLKEMTCTAGLLDQGAFLPLIPFQPASAVAVALSTLTSSAPHPRALRSGCH